MHKSAETIPCPNCGEQITKNAQACPFCGSDEQTGWSDRTYLDTIDIDDDVDYDELVRNEFPEKSPAPKKKSWIVVAGGIVLLCFIAAMLKILF